MDLVLLSLLTVRQLPFFWEDIDYGTLAPRSGRVSSIPAVRVQVYTRTIQGQGYSGFAMTPLEVSVRLP